MNAVNTRLSDVFSNRLKTYRITFTPGDPRLCSDLSEDARTVLKVQYRMHRSIMNFSNKEFYNGILEAADSVADHTLSDLVGETVGSGARTYIERVARSDTPISFIDTRGIDARERTRKGPTSKENPKEAEIVLSLLSELSDKGVNPEDIAVITPYDDQVDLIGRKLDEERLEVDTVDGFQGREKEVVILSLVRSNPDRNVGFLEDVRRLNVSITRAKRKLVIVGDSRTVGAHETYSSLIDYVSLDDGIIEAE